MLVVFSGTEYQDRALRQQILFAHFPKTSIYALKLKYDNVQMAHPLLKQSL